ncbi:hypothetical protein Mgra_00000473 [Meloidogyne graminicola]|nr:hypothetical protein Mgra_00000473 [Meloidogyne graminicola]
MVKELMK